MDSSTLNTAVEPTDDSLSTLRVVTNSLKEMDLGSGSTVLASDLVSPPPLTDSTMVSSKPIEKGGELEGGDEKLPGSQATIADGADKRKGFEVVPMEDLGLEGATTIDLPELGLGSGVKMERCFTI